ncbi:hypothetical protein E6C27_scaffold138G00960 [Cucumis melo var. makuwa]|uniref:Uncharacterized protein n=1 Tax=Cucumis melo var. makuwa TaxID=1194695 RepID=A0A5A7VL27_CUCMM|nr:hypothetical protein E6C27_scaffold138G00960 [Cucumis melo var. makuwa]
MGGELPLDPIPLESRPGILFVGSPNVGKRSLLSRLLTADFEDALNSSSQVSVHGWTINTQYYTADVSVSVAHLHEDFSIEALPMFNQLDALVMVFDMNDLSSLVTLQDWAAHVDLQKFNVLLCIGNKVDLVPGHPVHTEYRKLLQKQRLKDSSIDYSDTAEYGISETEGSSLLGDEDTSWETRRSCLEWCIERNIEFLEACASNADFDKCLSIDGDMQGVQRLYGALSAHMWPGMILNSGDKITKPSLPKEELSEEESDFEIDYEILSAGSAEPWDDTDYQGCSLNGEGFSIDAGAHGKDYHIAEQNRARQNISEGTKGEENPVAIDGELDQVTNPCEGKHLDLEDLERLMSEIGNMRDSLRLMPDFQRREMAAKLATKMAAMNGQVIVSGERSSVHRAPFPQFFSLPLVKMQKASNHQVGWGCDIADLIIEYELELGSHAETDYSWVSLSLLGKIVLPNLSLCCFV